MNIEEVRQYILSWPGVTEDQPFGDDIITFRVEGKIFVYLRLGGGRYDMKDGMPRFSCKLSPERNEELRDQYEAVQPAYHWNKRHWSDVYYEQLEPEMVGNGSKNPIGSSSANCPRQQRRNIYHNKRG